MKGGHVICDKLYNLSFIQVFHKMVELLMDKYSGDGAEIIRPYQQLITLHDDTDPKLTLDANSKGQNKQRRQRRCC